MRSHSPPIHTWMRDYDPTTGPYVEADPLGLVDGASVYGYVSGNPISRADPMGLACNGVGCYTTPDEAAAAHGGNYDRYYQLACSGGDTCACYARHIAANDTMSGHLADWWLSQWIGKLEDERSQCINYDSLKGDIRKGLAKRYANYLPQDPNRPSWPTRPDVARIHWDEFGEHGLPPSAFGGTPLGKDRGFNMLFNWCPNCR